MTDDKITKPREVSDRGKLNGLDLFSGIGGISLALKDWVRPIAYCENDRYAQSVLLSRMWDGSLSRGPIWDDVRTLRGNDFKGVDIITGGFPCQDISVAGHGLGLVGERSGLFWQIERLIKESNPRFVFLENVPAIRVRGLNSIIQTFTELGYDCRWTVVSAAEIGAVHIRKRWFLLAHADSMRLRQEQWSKLKGPNEKSGPMEHNSQSGSGGITGTPERPTKPRVDRAGDGIPDGMDRHRGLGNSVVPFQAKTAFERLMGAA